MPFIDVAGDTLHYTDEGSGTPVIFIHGSCGGAGQWSGMAGDIQTTHRAICLDMIGAGKSSPWPAGREKDPDVDANCIDAVLDRIEGPVHFVIHSCGGIYAFPSLLKHRARILSVSIFEPVFFHLLRLTGNPHFAEARGMAQRYRDHFDRGDVEGGLALFVDHWASAEGTWAGMPEPVRAKMRTWSVRLYHDWQLVDDDTPSLDDIASLGIPMLLVNGSKTLPAMHAVCELLQNRIPGLTRATIEGAGHMSPFSHASEAAELVRKHIESTIA